MACTPPASASEVFCRSAKCSRWAARIALAASVVMLIVISKAGNEFVRTAAAGNGGGAERIVGFLSVFIAQGLTLLTLLCLARRRFSASHHAAVKSANLKALELLAASTADEATKKDILGRAADLVAGKPGCCK